MEPSILKWKIYSVISFIVYKNLQICRERDTLQVTMHGTRKKVTIHSEESIQREAKEAKRRNKAKYFIKLEKGMQDN